MVKPQRPSKNIGQAAGSSEHAKEKPREEKGKAGTLSPPRCLVFVGQDRHPWVPGPLRRKIKKR